MSITMKYLIWYCPSSETYSHGTEMDLKINESLLGESLEVLYTLEEDQMFLVKKIVTQLNAARQEASGKYEKVLK